MAPSNSTLGEQYPNLPTIIGNPFFSIGVYFNTTWCTCRWKNSTTISTRKELCAFNPYSKIFYVISDSYNVDKSKRFLLENEIVNVNYFVNASMVQSTAYDNGTFIVKGPNFSLFNWKYGMLGTLSNQHPKLYSDSSFFFQFTSVGSGDRNGPGVLLKNIYSNECVTAMIHPLTSSIKLRMQTCSGVTTLKKATQKGEDVAKIYSQQKFFWTGRYLFSSIIGNENIGQLEAIAVTSSVFGSPYLKSKGVQWLRLESLNESNVEKFYWTACLYEQDSTLQSQLLADNESVVFASVLLLNHSSIVSSGLFLIFTILLGWINCL